ncbi:carbonic anhydrase [Flammula alnicola]|nr:carbonic anhydrase [Flammula alnicola]
MEDYATYLPPPSATHEERAAVGHTPPQQKPTIFWIGCADARVSEAKVLPGKEIFVQRNIANQFQVFDGNAIAALAYAVSLSTIEEIMVVGHTDCGGIHACYDAAHDHPPHLHWSLWNWLQHLKMLAITNKDLTQRQLTELNVRVQAANVCSVLSTVTNRQLKLSGYVYDVGNSKLEEVKLDL